MNIPIENPQDPAERVAMLKRHCTAHWRAKPGAGFFLISVPLRICPIGAHSDHQGGTVTGLTIDRSIQLFGQVADEPAVGIASANFGEVREIPFEGIADKIPGDWANYARGALVALNRSHGPLRRGFRGVIHGAMPIGGLSSSAAVTIAYLRALDHANGISLSTLETIALSRSVENDYLGLHSGIMDQSVILSGKRNSLSCVDCSTNTITSISQGAAAQPWEILVVYSGLSRQLTATPFNQRVQECHQAARELLEMARMPVSAKPLLSEAGAELFERFGDKLARNLQLRARHFFTEAARVREGMAVWPTGDMEQFGRLITASGHSSIVQFESGSPALIALYEILAAIPGVYGTRFCGGGFQGCCLAFIDPRKRESVLGALCEGYMKRHPELAGSYSLHLCRSMDSISVEELL